MPLFRSLPALLLGVSAFASVAFGQQITLSSIKFEGDSVYSQQELLAASGLKPGPSTQKSVEDAAQRLNDTGLFEEVNFASQGTALTYALKPVAASAMLPVRFSNFVWWDDAELNSLLREQVPLYRADQLPTTGSVHDAVIDVLTKLLLSKGVPNPAVTSLLVASHPGEPDGQAFQIGSPTIRVRSLALQQSSSAMELLLRKPISEISGQSWDEASFPGLIDSRVGDTYRDQGYLDVAITPPQHAAPVISNGAVDIDLTAAVTEGPQYRVSQLTWAGSPMLSPGDFAKDADLKQGAIASARALRTTLARVELAYSRQGYLQAHASAPPQLDRSAHTAGYTIAVDPGPQYHLRLIRWSGLTEASEQNLNSRWKMTPGSVYDATYPLNFLQENSTQVPSGLKPDVQAHVNPADHSVDLVVVFSRRNEPLPGPLDQPATAARTQSLR